MEKVKIVIQGAGVSSLALCQLLLDYGVPKGNVFLIDSKGIVRTKRNDLGKYKRVYAVTTDKKSFDDAISGADIVIGLSRGGKIKPDQISKMNDKPIVFALSLPNPEILPDEVSEVAPDAIVATGRADLPNHVT